MTSTSTRRSPTARTNSAVGSAMPSVQPIASVSSGVSAAIVARHPAPGDAAS